MDILRQVMRQIELGWAYVTSCLAAPLSAPACKTFWTWTSVAGVAVGLFVLWKVLAWLLRPLQLWLEDRRRRARERELADPDTMARYKVDDNKLFSAPGEDDVQQRIRDALDRKKIDEQHQRHHQTLGNKKL
jgi:hypothetical protein